MRMTPPALALAACLGLSACQQSSSQAQEAAPAPVKKDLGRSQVMYQGQAPIVKIDTAAVLPGKAPDSLELKVQGEAAGPGYTDAEFLPRIYPGPPSDGVYEVDVVATKPAAATAAVTPIEVKSGWGHYPQAHLKAVRFMSATNAVVVPVTLTK